MFDCVHIMLYVADSVDSPWCSLVEGPAVEALHAMVSHDKYCQKLLECDTVDSQTFRDVLSALLPSSELTFGACLARLATQHWDQAASKGSESTVKGKDSAPRGVVEPGSSLVPQDIRVTICSSVHKAVLVGFLFIHYVSFLHPHS